MRKALHGIKGDRIDLATFVEREGSVDHSNWVVMPICPGCGDDVSPVNAKMTQGFYETRTELLSTFKEQGRITQTPHFRHKRRNLACPYDDEKDPFFDIFSKSYFDYRDEKRVRDTLIAAKDFNAKVIGALYKHLTGQFVMFLEKKKKLWSDSEKVMCRMSVLAHESWIFPFAQILFAGSQQRTFKTSGKSILWFSNLSENKPFSSKLRNKGKYGLSFLKASACSMTTLQSGRIAMLPLDIKREGLKLPLNFLKKPHINL